MRIDVLPDDVLLEIFDFYMVMTPGNGKRETEAWQSLVHVCRQWRNLVFLSPRRLNLRIYCTPKTPVKDTLDVWPALPLVIVDIWASSSGMDNIIAALGQSNRVCKVILLAHANWQMEEVLATMRVPFPKLTDQILSSFNETPPVIPDLFLGGSSPRLRSFELYGFPFQGLPDLLLSATHLVSLRLSDIPHSGYVSPETIVALLSELSSLETLSLGFISPESRPDWESRSLPSPNRSILPALNKFRFQGVTEYLEDLVTSIDSPQLDTFYITFFKRIDFDTPRLAQFINRTPTLRACDKAHVKFGDRSTSVALLARSKTLKISISCGEPDQQLSSIAQVCSSSLPSPSTVEDLYVEPQLEFLEVWKNSAIEDILWLQLILPFTAVKNLYLSKEFAPGIAAALQGLPGGRITEVLPSLQSISVEGLEPSGPFQENTVQFVVARQLSGHPIAISVWNEPIMRLPVKGSQ
jgi:hypothetical protein